MTVFQRPLEGCYTLVNIALIIAEGTRLDRSGLTDSVTSAVLAALQTVAYVALCAKVQSYTSRQYERPIVNGRRSSIAMVAEGNASYAGLIGIVSTVFCWITWHRLRHQAAITLNQAIWAAANTASALRFCELAYSRVMSYWPQKDSVVNVQAEVRIEMAPRMEGPQLPGTSEVV